MSRPILGVEVTVHSWDEVKPNFVDEAADPDNCTDLYQLQLVTPGVQIGNLLETLINPDQVISAALQNLTPVQAAMNWGILYPICILLKTLGYFFSSVIETLIGRLSGGLGALGSTIKTDVIIRILDFLCFGALRKLRVIQAYQANLTLPVNVPTPAEAGSAWLSGKIDDCAFETYVKAGDMKFEPYKRVVTAQEYKFSPLELITLSRRNKLKRGDLKSRLRELGALHEEDSVEGLALFEQLPGPADLVRMMVRDVVNPTINQTFKTDTEFTSNYQGKLREWAEQQGLTEEIMMYQWRAHWAIPSPTQLYEILHRRRHAQGRGGPAKVLSDIRTALVQQDILPYWHDDLIAISFHPLTRTDLNRAFEHGWIQDAEYLDGMYNNGYSDLDSDTLLRFAIQERNHVIRHLEPVRMFREGLIDTKQLENALTQYGFDPSVLPIAVTEGVMARDLDLQALMLKGLLHQYKLCRIGEQEFRQEAAIQGIPKEAVDFQLSAHGWNTSCGSRKESIANLCQALDQGMVTPQEYLDRAKAMKFDDVAANRHLDLCMNKKAAAQAKAALRAQQAAQKAAQKAAQDATKDAAKAERQAEKLAKQLEALERARQNRNRILEDATAKLVKTLGADPAIVAPAVHQLYDALQHRFGLAQNEAANALALTATNFKGPDWASFEVACNQTAESALKDPFILFPMF